MSTETEPSTKVADKQLLLSDFPDSTETPGILNLGEPLWGEDQSFTKASRKTVDYYCSFDRDPDRCIFFVESVIGGPYIKRKLPPISTKIRLIADIGLQYLKVVGQDSDGDCRDADRKRPCIYVSDNWPIYTQLTVWEIVTWANYGVNNPPLFQENYLKAVSDLVACAKLAHLEPAINDQAAKLMDKFEAEMLPSEWVAMIRDNNTWRLYATHQMQVQLPSAEMQPDTSVDTEASPHQLSF